MEKRNECKSLTQKTSELIKAEEYLNIVEDCLIKIDALNDKMRNNFDSLFSDIDSMIEELK
jgi:hypothetical protein